MSSEPIPSATSSHLITQEKKRSDARRTFWRILTTFDAAKLTPYQALRNSIGVALPLIAGYLLGMPRGGLAVASGALNVSYSDGGDPYPARARRMLASSLLCAVAVIAGSFSGGHAFSAVLTATLWAFVAGMSVAIGGSAPDLGVISLVTVLIYAAQPLTPRQSAYAGVLALGGGLLQTALSVALWPVRRYSPERRALGNFYLELANSPALPLLATAAPMASVNSARAEEAMSGLSRDAAVESLRYRALFDQASRIRLSLLMILRLRLRMERENPAYPPIEIIAKYLAAAVNVLSRIGNSLLDTPSSPPPGELDALNVWTAKLRELLVAAPHSFLSATAKQARYQMDALNGQLRAASDLENRA